MSRIEIINAFIAKYGYKSYLEIGVQGATCFNNILCEYKVGVDPDPASGATKHITSDEFFKHNKEKFSIGFVDGLHHSEQSYRDIINLLDCLDENGTIAVHDNLPTSKRMQEIPLQEQNEWTGDVWRSWLKLRATRPDLYMSVVDSDWGVGIIQRGSQECIKLRKPLDEITYEDFEANKHEWMNVISVSQFKQLYLQNE